MPQFAWYPSIHFHISFSLFSIKHYCYLHLISFLETILIFNEKLKTTGFNQICILVYWYNSRLLLAHSRIMVPSYILNWKRWVMGLYIPKLRKSKRTEILPCLKTYRYTSMSEKWDIPNARLYYSPALAPNHTLLPSSGNMKRHSASGVDGALTSVVYLKDRPDQKV